MGCGDAFGGDYFGRDFEFDFWDFVFYFALVVSFCRVDLRVDVFLSAGFDRWFVFGGRCGVGVVSGG